jgi:hypothetical protein
MFNTYEDKTFSPKGPNIGAAHGIRQQEINERRQKEIRNNHQKNIETSKKIIENFKKIITSETKIIIFEKPETIGQPDKQIELTNFQITDDKISFLRSDNPKNRTSMKFVPFCIVTKLGIKNENGLLEENLKIYPTSTKLDQTS